MINSPYQFESFSSSSSFKISVSLPPSSSSFSSSSYVSLSSFFEFHFGFRSKVAGAKWTTEETLSVKMVQDAVSKSMNSVRFSGCAADSIRFASTGAKSVQGLKNYSVVVNFTFLYSETINFEKSLDMFLLVFKVHFVHEQRCSANHLGCILLGLFWLFLFRFRNNRIH